MNAFFINGSYIWGCIHFKSLLPSTLVLHKLCVIPRAVLAPGMQLWCPKVVHFNTVVFVFMRIRSRLA